MIRKIAVVALLLSFAAVGCGGDDDDEKSSSSSAAVTSCNAYCDKLQSVSCDLYTSADECKSFECEDLGGAPADCGSAAKAYYDCATGSADPCMDDCSTELDAYFNACS